MHFPLPPERRWEGELVLSMCTACIEDGNKLQDQGQQLAFLLSVTDPEVSVLKVCLL